MNVSIVSNRQSIVKKYETNLNARFSKKNRRTSSDNVSTPASNRSRWIEVLLYLYNYKFCNLIGMYRKTQLIRTKTWYFTDVHCTAMYSNVQMHFKWVWLMPTLWGLQVSWAQKKRRKMMIRPMRRGWRGWHLSSFASRRWNSEHWSRSLQSPTARNWDLQRRPSG